MSILDRLSRVVKAELNEIKRVMSDRDDDPEAARQRKAEALKKAREKLAKAEAELARARQVEAEARAAQAADVWRPADGGATAGGGTVDAGAAHWGAPTTTEAPANAAPASAPTPAPIDDGAAAWRAGGAPAPERARPGFDPATTLYPREIRQAFAALEIPMGADRARIEAAHRQLQRRYHPDNHRGDARRLAVAQQLTRGIDDAKAKLLAWLTSRGL